VIDVVAGALFDAAGRVLIAQRPAGKVLAGRWEFPGGKLHEGESAYDGLARELLEELGVQVHAAERVIRYSHEYADRSVWLDLWAVTDWSGEPRGLDGQALKWVDPGRLHEEDLLEADAPMVAALLERPAPRWPVKGTLPYFGTK
jgi:8-oxo-dGTP diphosphatase